jgi:hypothetical protein
LFHNRHIARTATVAALCLVVACGESDGPTVAELTTANAQMAASQGVGAIDFLSSMGELVDEFSEVIESEGSLTIPCADGNVLIGINDVGEQGQLSTGDSVSVDFQACVLGEGDGATLNGGFTFTATEVTEGVEGAFSVKLSVQFDALSVVSSEGTIVVDGGFVSELSSTDGLTIVAVIRGSKLSAYAQGGDESFSGSIKNFRLERQYTMEEGDYVASFDAVVSTSELGGQVEYETVTPFAGNEEGDNPDSGVLTIKGAGGAKVTLVALDDENVEILLDLNDDGEPEFTILTTWDVLEDDEISGSDL